MRISSLIISSCWSLSDVLPGFKVCEPLKNVDCEPLKKVDCEPLSDLGDWSILSCCRKTD